MIKFRDKAQASDGARFEYSLVDTTLHVKLTLKDTVQEDSFELEVPPEDGKFDMFSLETILGYNPFVTMVSEGGVLWVTLLRFVDTLPENRDSEWRDTP